MGISYTMGFVKTLCYVLQVSVYLYLVQVQFVRVRVWGNTTVISLYRGSLYGNLYVILIF